jgi:CHAT domain-containing protein
MLVDQTSLGSTAVELFWFEEVLWVFVVGPGSFSPHVESKALGSREIDQIFNELPDVILQPEGGLGSPSWKRLSELICEPLLGHLETANRLVVIPYGPFHFLPLHLLVLEGAPLIQSHAVVYAPSASVLHYCQQKNPKRADSEFQPRTVTAVGLDFEEEAEMVARYFDDAEVIRGSRTHITKELVQSSCRKRDIVHFSAHCEFAPGDPERSGLVLHKQSQSPDPEHLTLSDVYNMQLDSYLITLGACSSGIGDYASGDELINLTRGFLYAGTPSVLASLWPVPNEPTVVLMERFYAHLLRDHLDKADALRYAQLEVSEQLPKPVHWAGFTLTGDWI